MSKKHTQLCLSILFAGVVFGTIFGPSACKPQPEETNLSFETIEQKERADTGQFHEAREPKLMVVSRLEEVDSLNGLVTEEAKGKLQMLDYSQYFVLLVLQGWKPTTGYKVDVDRIIRLGNTVNIYAQFQEPKPGVKKASAITSPYHLMRVRKMGGWGQDITFNLLVDETIVSSISHVIP